MSRSGRPKAKDPSRRRCIATGETRPRAGLIRFVAGPDGQVVADVLEKLPGRGVWVSADLAALERAVTRRLFARALKAPATPPDGLIGQVEAQLAHRVVGLISLARKSGEAVAGYGKVRDWLLKGQAQVLIQAADGSERGKTKLRPPDESGASYVGCLTARELGLAFGRENVIHGALAAGGLARRVVEEATRLSGVREDVREKTAGKPAGREGARTI